MIPITYNEWTNCIVNECKIDLTKEFAKQRLKIYLDSNQEETKRFISLYGDAHLKNIIIWFTKIANQ